MDIHTIIHSGENPLPTGEPTYCNYCNKAYYEIHRLQGNIGLCPKHFEQAMNGNSEICRYMENE